MRAFQSSCSVIILRRFFAVGFVEAVMLCSRILAPTLLIDRLERASPGEAGPAVEGVEIPRLSFHQGMVGCASVICGHERMCGRVADALVLFSTASSCHEPKSVQCANRPSSTSSAFNTPPVASLCKKTMPRCFNVFASFMCTRKSVGAVLAARDAMMASFFFNDR